MNERIRLLAVEGWVKIDEVREHLDSVGCGTIYKTSGEDRVPLYTIPPQRKPLTDEQVAYVLAQLPIPPKNGVDLHDWAMQAVRVLAAHDIKE